MSPPGRPKGEHRRAEHDRIPSSPPGRPKGEHRRAEHDRIPSSPPGRPKGEPRRAEHDGISSSPPGRPKGEHRRAEHDALAHEVGELLAARGALCATAESCTGGLVAGALTAIAGSSAWFERGFVTYSNEAKHELLGVPTATIEQHGAVSEATARAMAEGALARTPSTVAIAVAITGIAGPGGGSADKPVGTVCFGWAVRGGPTRVVTRRFDGDRDAVRRASVTEALAGLAVAAATLPPPPR